MSTDPEVVKHYLEDPLNVVGNVRARTGNEILKAFRAANKRAGELALPIYAAHGTADRCTSFPALKRLLTQACWVLSCFLFAFVNGACLLDSI